MILYHFSDTRYSELMPTIGPRRHQSEDPRAVGKAVIWLTDSPDRAPGVENQARFRHEVEIDEKDPCLFKDEPTEGLKSDWQLMFHSQQESLEGMEASYFYTKSIWVKSVVSLNCA